MRQSSIDRESKRAEILRKKKRKDRIEFALGMVIAVPVTLIVGAFLIGGMLWGALWFWTHLPI